MSSPPAKRQRTLRSSDINSQSTQSSKVRKPGNAPPRFIIPSGVDKENQNPNSKTKASTKAPAKAADPKSPSKPNESKAEALGRLFRGAKTTKPRGASRPASPITANPEEDDAIQDDFLEPGSGSVYNQSGGTTLPEKRPAERPKAPKLTGRAHAFAGPAIAQAAARSEGTDGKSSSSARPWAELYGPENASELAVHKKKVVDVKSWLSNVLTGREHKRLLVLEGPSGSGKSSTLKALSRDLNFELVEWSNSTDTSSASEGFTSSVMRFDDFLNRSGTYSSLQTETLEASTARESKSAAPPMSGAKVIIMEEFPVTLPFHEESLKAFRLSLSRYLASSSSGSSSQVSSTRSCTPATPVVMVISEGRTGASGSAADSLTSYRLVGRDILDHPAVTSIEFNPIAPTMITKALELIARKEARHSGRRRTPGSEVLKALSELGDLRNAANCLEMLCQRGGKDGDWSGRIAGSKSTKTAPTKMEKEAIRTIALRDSTLSLFHAAGKVLYNKRVAPEKSSPPIRPPDFLDRHARTHISEVQLDQLMDETGADAGTFVATLHENYALSCHCNDEVDVMGDCLISLSDSDLLNPASARTSSGSYQGRIPRSGDGAVEYMLQDEISFQTAVRGLLFSLPYPVKRGSGQQGQARSGDAFKMFYPASLRLWKQVDQFKTSISGLSHLWSGDTSHLEEAEAASSSEPTSSAKFDELVQERLPYLLEIARQTRSQGELSELRRLMRFQGVGSSSEESEGLQEGLDVGSRLSQPNSFKQTEFRSNDAPETLDSIAGKLVLSDDDIEDD